MGKITHVIKRSGAQVPFNPDRIANAIYRAAVAVGGRDKERSQRLAEKVVTYLEEHYGEGTAPQIEEIQDAVEKILIENGHASVAKAYILYREERAQKRQEKARRASIPSENVPWAKIWGVLDWASSRGLDSISALNRRIEQNEFPHIVHESEAAYEADLDMAAEMALGKIEKLRMIFISGPSSSGKTTTTIKLGERLQKHGLKLIALNVDNYFFDLEMHPKDEFGDYDFETPQALDLELINQHYSELIEGHEVKIPFYDFKTGSRKLDQTPMKLASDEILLIDSLHGLYPPMTAGIDPDRMFKLYLEPLLQMRGPDDDYIRWTDLRLMRRMLRDAKYRAYNPQQTLEHWHYVRASELRNIIPYINTTDYIVNTGMPYELPIYRPMLLEYFEKWNTEYVDDPLHEDAYDRASRVYRILKAVHAVEDDSSIPASSVLREFIGGSCYEY
ncbi:MAG: hypothetical protein JXA25_03105 [Anaerolineales bacterium]|nr:hypothetical protein [Anaerolineales bacterium]